MEHRKPRGADYLIGTAAEWTRKYGVDAWRLDVPDEVSFRFLEHFKKRIRETNPEAYIIGEIWQKSTAWLRAGVFDGAMDYPLYFAIRDFAMKRTDGVETFAERIKDVFLSAPDCVRPETACVLRQPRYSAAAHRLRRGYGPACGRALFADAPRRRDEHILWR